MVDEYSNKHDVEHGHVKEGWMDRNWQVLVIVFGLSFLSVLLCYHPTL